MMRIRMDIGRVASLAKSGSSLGHFSSSCAGLATALLLALSASGTSAAESPRYHYLGFAPQIAVHEKSRGAYEHDLYHRGVPDLGLKLFYKRDVGQSLALGLEIEGRTLGIGDDLNLAMDHRYAALLEWNFRASAVWQPYAIASLGLSVLWRDGNLTGSPGLGPAGALALGVRRWFGNWAPFAFFEGQAALRWEMNDGSTQESLTGALLFGLGVQFKL